MEMLELAAELKGCREQIAAYEVERAQMQQYYRRAIADRDDAKATISRLRDELASWQEAFGLLTTLHGSIQIDSSDPMGMAKQIESHVRATIERLREYAGHKPECIVLWMEEQEQYPCDCGYDDLVKEIGE